MEEGGQGGCCLEDWSRGEASGGEGRRAGTGPPSLPPTPFLTIFDMRCQSKKSYLLHKYSGKILDPVSKLPHDLWPHDPRGQHHPDDVGPRDCTFVIRIIVNVVAIMHF